MLARPFTPETALPKLNALSTVSEQETEVDKILYRLPNFQTFPTLLGQYFLHEWPEIYLLI